MDKVCDKNTVPVCIISIKVSFVSRHILWRCDMYALLDVLNYSSQNEYGCTLLLLLLIIVPQSRISVLKYSVQRQTFTRATLTYVSELGFFITVNIKINTVATVNEKMKYSILCARDAS